jgi:hypothetical protein
MYFRLYRPNVVCQVVFPPGLSRLPVETTLEWRMTNHSRLQVHTSPHFLHFHHSSPSTPHFSPTIAPQRYRRLYGVPPLAYFQCSEFLSTHSPSCHCQWTLAQLLPHRDHEPAKTEPLQNRKCSILNAKGSIMTVSIFHMLSISSAPRSLEFEKSLRKSMKILSMAPSI